VPDEDDEPESADDESSSEPDSQFESE
jgi:hypothetical protein